MPPSFNSRCDHAGTQPTRADTRWSAIGFVAASVVFLPWFLIYIIAGDTVLSPNMYRILDATRLNVANLGLPGQ
jgi:hypothetical protein